MVLSKTTFFDMRDIDSISFSKKCFTAMKESGNIERNSKLTQGSLIVTVRDTGCGIDEDNLKKLFKKYGQVGEDPEKNKLGYGLGLWYTKYLLNKLNGKIDFRSTKNVGTWVKIEIPCKVVHKAVPEQYIANSELVSHVPTYQQLSQPQPPVKPHKPRASIFIREDERLANLLVAEYLKKHGQKNVDIIEVKSVSEIYRSDKLRDTDCVLILGEKSSTRQESQSLRILLGLYRGDKLPLILLRDTNGDFQDGENKLGER